VIHLRRLILGWRILGVLHYILGRGVLGAVLDRIFLVLVLRAVFLVGSLGRVSGRLIFDAIFFNLVFVLVSVLVLCVLIRVSLGAPVLAGQRHISLGSVQDLDNGKDEQTGSNQAGAAEQNQIAPRPGPAHGRQSQAQSFIDLARLDLGFCFRPAGSGSA